MHRLTVFALTLLVIVASVLARETNADRLKRGYPPLPPDRRDPSRRDAAKRNGPSGVPPPAVPPPTPQVVSGVMEVRDKGGNHRLGFVSSQIQVVNGVTSLGVLDPGDLAMSDRLPVNCSFIDFNLRPTPKPPIPPSPPAPCVGPGPGPDPSPLTLLQCPPKGPWGFDLTTNEFQINLPGQSGGAQVPALFSWDQTLNQLAVVSSWTPDKLGQSLPVRVFMSN